MTREMKESERSVLVQHPLLSMGTISPHNDSPHYVKARHRNTQHIYPKPICTHVCWASFLRLCSSFIWVLFEDWAGGMLLFHTLAAHSCTNVQSAINLTVINLFKLIIHGNSNPSHHNLPAWKRFDLSSTGQAEQHCPLKEPLTCGYCLSLNR